MTEANKAFNQVLRDKVAGRASAANPTEELIARGDAALSELAAVIQELAAVVGAEEAPEEGEKA